MNTPSRRSFLTGTLAVAGTWMALPPCAFAQISKHRAQEHYAAIWSKHATGPWLARHNLTSDAYQREFDQQAADGYRLVSVSGYEVAGRAHYAAIWRKAAGPAWIARHGLSGDAYQAAFNQHAADGYRLIWINGYSIGGQAQYAAIWEKSAGAAWVARHGLTSAQYQSAFDEYAKQGYRLDVVSGYAQGAEERYAALWRKGAADGANAAWVARHGLSSDDYQAAFNTYSAQGYRLKQVSGYRVNGQARFAAIWDKSGGGEQIARHGMSSSAYQQEFDTLAQRGFTLDQVSGY